VSRAGQHGRPLILPRRVAVGGARRVFLVVRRINGMGVRITVSTLHKKFMPSLGQGPKPAGRWGGRPIDRPADVLEWAAKQITESRKPA
jgi:hypothetical protein